MNVSNNCLCITIPILVVLSVLSCTGQAAENGGSSYLPGFYGDFGMALMPTSGNYLSNFAGYNTAESSNASNELIFELPGILHITDVKLLEGKYLFGFFPYVLHTQAESVSGSDVSSSARAGWGDMYALPVAFSWQWQQFSLLLFEGVVLPTGSYDKNSSLNQGRNYWTLDSNVAITWQPLNTSYELSLNLGYMVNTTNTATDYRTGDELHLDYLLGYYINSNFGLGLAGSYYQQLTEDQGLSVPSNLPLAEYSSIGPAILYNFKLDARDISLSLKWLHEYGVNNHISGDYIILRTFLNF
ncbi:SphA family protein [Methylocucumis oryzae]|uniref:SphA family protein n=1 Tax=Methylocucumis oryzae TaxID=1632867 RepID=UPI0009E3752D|nr:transporter [Methylocucumis oryzae]